MICTLSVSSDAANLQTSSLHAAELIAALLRGTCSKIEYQIKNDDSRQAGAKRFLISFVRSVHDILLLANHSSGYKAYDYAWLGIDVAQKMPSVQIFMCSQ